MHGSPLTGWLLVVLCAAVGAYCLRRTACAPPGRRRAAGQDALMGIGMAAMAVPGSALAPRPWTTAVFVVVFVLAAVRAVFPLRHAGTHPHHVVGALAMVYMALAMQAAGPHGGHTGAGLPLVTGGLLAYFLVYSLRSGVRLVATGAGTAVAGGGEGGRGELVAGCRVAMGIGMFAMLLGM
ncbi:hypothetical protein SRB5_18540 [Streptomyces sp. RB5]|uniref:DUF5134 domain-containing protein n=1 Tax=Streptomyces smaragdinus TaxID=2585196 RepID=A0A7K0CE39_9ACTN|nr:DUF5134 domain-containing protein [Streptomyces smaragdinus]MQY11735.1 hypothetical protein [Streptomyces smaragdinus]